MQSNAVPLNVNQNVRKLVMSTKYPSTSGYHNVAQSRSSSFPADTVKRIRTASGVYEIVRKSPPPLQQKPSFGNFSSELEKQFHELKKQTDELRKQFELSQKQNEEYRKRLDKLEKEVRLLNGNHSNEESEMLD